MGKLIRGQGGSDSSSDPYIPVEAENSAGANTYARLIDLLCEGTIGGPANDDSWYKSTYYNEIPVQNADDSFNYSGVTIDGRIGTVSQEYLTGFSGIENSVAVNAPVTVASGPISRTISDADVDACKIAITIPTLMEQKDNGDIVGASFRLTIAITPNNGAGTKQTAVDQTITGKYVSAYRHQFLLTDLAQYGSAPWVITIERITDDSGTVKLVNAFSWYSYTTIIETKLRYTDRVVIGHTINSSQFGDQIPSRAYKIDGIADMQIPSNYDPETRTYDGDWDGTFTTGCTNNPAWIVYYLLTNRENGLGLSITEAMVDKWSLYSCATYCDELISVTTRVRQEDGTYTDTVFSEPRFSFNGVIEARGQAMEMITYVSGAMRAFPVWSEGQVSFVQDKPITSPARPVSLSNVTEDGFQYTGIPKRNRHSVVKVSWNDPSIFGKLDVIELVDEEAIINFGYNEMDFAAIGCTSRTEAIRRGRHALDTDTNAREAVSFVGGIEWADALPGELIAIQDPNYAAVVLEGRVKSGTTTSLVLDKALVLESAVTYTMLIQTADGGGAERVLSNIPATTDTLTWTTPLDAAPFTGAVMVLSASNVATRKFVIVSVSEDDGEYTVSGIEYDADKYARIDSGVVSEIPDNTSLLSTVLTPPTDLVIEAFTYTLGDQGVRLYGMQIGWTPSLDPRVNQYEIRYRPSSGGWTYLATTTGSNFDWRPVPGDTYDISVRGIGVGPASSWLEYTDFVLAAALTDLAPPTNLDTKEGGGIWAGLDCTVTWTPSTGSQYASTYDDDVGDSNVEYYKVEIRKPDTTLLRSFNTASDASEYTYFYSHNVEDHDGTPSRNLLFFVYAVDMFGQASATYASVSASNPAPDMSGTLPVIIDKYGFLRVTWAVSTDNDIDYYKVYLGTSNPPTESVAIVKHPGNSVDLSGLDYDTDYFVQIEPFDGFGAGTKSVIPAAGSILKIPSVNVDVELSGSITKTDSDGNNAATLAKLYNGAFSSDGVAYTLAGTDKYIQYQYGVGDYFDRVGIWSADANARVYIAYSEDGVTWSYLKASSGHSLNIDSDLVAATNQTDARTTYWQLAAGLNVGMFPNNTVANYIRLYLTGTYSTTIYEFVPSRILISELAAIKHLSSYSANIGLVSAGVLQSSNYTSSDGMRINLDDSTISIRSDGNDVLTYDPVSGLYVYGTVTVSYGDVTGTPNSLADISSSEYAILNDGATVGATWGTNVANQPADEDMYNSYANAYTENWSTQGADVTADNTSADTLAVDGVASETIRSNAIYANGAVVASQSDMVFSIMEKRQWVTNWPGMNDNYIAVIEAAVATGSSVDAVEIARDNLYNFLNTDHNVFGTLADSDFSTTTDLSNLTKVYYYEMQKCISDTAFRNASNSSNFVPCLYWGFENTVAGNGTTWIGRSSVSNTLTAGYNYATLTTTGNIASIKLNNTSLEIDGAKYTTVRARLKQVSGNPGVTFRGNLFWETVDHGVTTAYYAQCNRPFDQSNWTTYEWDITKAIAGADDWLSSVITSLRIDITSTDDSVWLIDWIAVGKSGVADSTQDAIDTGLDTEAGGMIVRNAATGDYAHLTSADLDFYYDDDGTPKLYQSVNRVQPVTAVSGVAVVIPGIWKKPPMVYMFPATTQTFEPSLGTAQKQALTIEVATPTLTGVRPREYQFIAYATIDSMASLLTYSDSDVTITDYAAENPPVATTGSTPANAIAFNAGNLHLTANVVWTLKQPITYSVWARALITVKYVVAGISTTLINVYTPEYWGKYNTYSGSIPVDTYLTPPGSGARTGYFVLEVKHQVCVNYSKSDAYNSTEVQSFTEATLEQPVMTYTAQAGSAVAAGTMQGFAIGG